MKIDQIELREIRMRLRSPFETSFGSFQDRRMLLVQVHCDGAEGWAECTAMERPFFNYETIDFAWSVLSDYLIPQLANQDLTSAADIPLLLAPIRGHEMSKAALENAVWDLEAQIQGESLGRHLGGTLEQIPCGVSLGIQPSVDQLLALVEREVAAGYQRIKLKIKPGKDVEYVREVRRHFPHIRLSVDANSAYSLDDAEHLKKLDEFDLLMIEQPLEWDDMYRHSLLQPQLATSLCLDESIRHLRDATAAVEMGACRVINIKLGRVGGHTEARRIQRFCAERGIPAWCGGMIESGIGRSHNIAMSTQAGFVLPGDVSASQRYWDEDIIEPEVEITPIGTICVPKGPGLGYTVRHSRVQQLTVRHKTFSFRSVAVSIN
ncbi:MAG TPA: o-succinylbenzoate synthase [Bryobacteraceae bacterium]|nr:o-succinylbenzoate synthase [Bryobacteraceae bacterium]